MPTVQLPMLIECWKLGAKENHDPRHIPDTEFFPVEKFAATPELHQRVFNKRQAKSVLQKCWRYPELLKGFHRRNRSPS